MNPINKIKWEEQFKIRLAKAEESMDVHDVVKILLVRKLIRNSKNKIWLRIYTGFDLGDLIPDIYVENIKEKSIVCYEIQENLNNNYVENKTKQYNELDIPYFNSIDLIVIPLKECPEKVSEISKWLEKYTI
jgi:hypothetical protein